MPRWSTCSAAPSKSKDVGNRAMKTTIAVFQNGGDRGTGDDQLTMNRVMRPV